MINYKQYVLRYYYKPFFWMSSEELASLQSRLDKVNKESGKNFNYGIFDPKNQESFYKNSMICIMELNGEPAGFFYNVIMEGEFKIVHQGLVLISKNVGENLLYYPYVQSNRLIWEQIGDFYISNISSVPSIIGQVSTTYDQVWPSPYLNLDRPEDKNYIVVCEVLFKNYVKKFFPFPEEISLNKKRFVISSKVKEMGFDSNFRNLSRHPKLEVNLFCQFWIDYEKSEDIIQVGRFTKQTIERNS